MDELSKLFNMFWLQFCAAYQENDIPKNTKFPYITYSVVRPTFGEQTITIANIYDKSQNFTRLRAIGAAIEKAIPEGGIILDAPSGGALHIERSNPFIQSRSLPADEVRDNIKSDMVSVIIRSFITN